MPGPQHRHIHGHSMGHRRHTPRTEHRTKTSAEPGTHQTAAKHTSHTNHPTHQLPRSLTSSRPRRHGPHRAGGRCQGRRTARARRARSAAARPESARAAAATRKRHSASFAHIPHLRSALVYFSQHCHTHRPHSVSRPTRNGCATSPGPPRRRRTRLTVTTFSDPRVQCIYCNLES